MNQPLADIGDFEVRYGTTIAVEDRPRVVALLDDASALVYDATGQTFLDAEDNQVVPGAVLAIVVAAARRAFENPSGFQSETFGDYTWRGGVVGSSGVYLTKEERQVCLRATGSSAIGTIGLEGYLTAPSVGQFVPCGDGDEVLYFAENEVPD